jgi:hypothetical protein
MMELQKMMYKEDGKIFTVTCAVTEAQMGGEYTFTSLKAIHSPSGSLNRILWWFPGMVLP